MKSGIRSIQYSLKIPHAARRRVRVGEMVFSSEPMVMALILRSKDIIKVYELRVERESGLEEVLLRAVVEILLHRILVDAQKSPVEGGSVGYKYISNKNRDTHKSDVKDFLMK